MDKYEIVLHLIGNPDNYTPGQIAEILSDPETAEIYNLLCKSDSAIKACHKTEIDAEWEIFLEKHAVTHRHINLWSYGNRAASIAVIIAISMVVMAAVITVNIAVNKQKQEPLAEEETFIPADIPVERDTMITQNDTLKTNLKPVQFEDVPLEKIMTEIANTYGIEVRFNNKEAASLHLYYKFNPTLPLYEVVEQLNTFERINISLDGNILNID